MGSENLRRLEKLRGGGGGKLRHDQNKKKGMIREIFKEAPKKRDGGPKGGGGQKVSSTAKGRTNPGARLKKLTSKAHKRKKGAGRTMGEKTPKTPLFKEARRRDHTGGRGAATNSCALCTI